MDVVDHMSEAGEEVSLTAIHNKVTDARTAFVKEVSTRKARKFQVCTVGVRDILYVPPGWVFVECVAS